MHREQPYQFEGSSFYEFGGLVIAEKGVFVIMCD